jgi:uncharacterized membrane protein YuzA (DUF378 family)
MKSNKILNIIITLIAVVGGILFIRTFMEDAEALETDVDLGNKVISPLIYYSTYLFYITVGVSIVLSLLSMFRNPENLKKTLGAIGVLVVLFLVAYFLADSAAVYDANGLKVLPGGEEGSSTNKWVGAGIWYSVILGLIASFFFVFDLLKGLVKS